MTVTVPNLSKSRILQAALERLNTRNIIGLEQQRSIHTRGYQVGYVKVEQRFGPQAAVNDSIVVNEEPSLADDVR